MIKLGKYVCFKKRNELLLCNHNIMYYWICYRYQNAITFYIIPYRILLRIRLYIFEKFNHSNCYCKVNDTHQGFNILYLIFNIKGINGIKEYIPYSVYGNKSFNAPLILMWPTHIVLGLNCVYMAVYIISYIHMCDNCYWIPIQGWHRNISTLIKYLVGIWKIYIGTMVKNVKMD